MSADPLSISALALSSARLKAKILHGLDPGALSESEVVAVSCRSDSDPAGGDFAEDETSDKSAAN